MKLTTHAFVFCLAAAAPALLSGCGKEVKYSTDDPALSELLSQLENRCGADQVVHWTFTQSGTSRSRPVDILLVIDSSTSLSAERTKIATEFPQALGAVMPGTD